MQGLYQPIRDYSIIGNLRSAVLVSKDGSIDWAPAPFIDSPSVFARILDVHKGGFWSITPSTEFTSEQYYLEKTNILVTEFSTKDGVVCVTDFIPTEKEKTYLPEEKDTTFKIKRKIECTKGKVTLNIIFCPKFNYARGETTLSVTDHGVSVKDETHQAVLVSEHSFEISDDKAHTEISLDSGQSEFLIFRYNTGEVVSEKNNHDHHENELQENIKHWRGWVDKCDLGVCAGVGGVWEDSIIRSLLTLKILFFEPVGTIAAAATTSLPEDVGGIRNWDYRFTWLRDSAFVFDAFFKLGHTEEAEEYIDWLISECFQVRDPADIKIMYGLRGEKDLTEEVLPDLEGYKGSYPVRIGNAAHDQKQWDIYGSIFDVVWNLHELKGGNVLSEETWKQLVKIADYVVNIWREPDEGLWEVRGGRQNFVYSKVMCWVALDRACKLKSVYGFKDGDSSKWKDEASLVHEEVFKQGWSENRQSFVQSFESESLDAALLLLPKVGFIKGNDPRMISTIDAIQEELCYEKAFVYRYTSADGLPGEEGVFLVASFWLVEALALAGKKDAARIIFEKILSKGNHTGLFSEELDPKTDDFLGNFPQAYTHVGLINSALALTERRDDSML